MAMTELDVIFSVFVSTIVSIGWYFLLDVGRDIKELRKDREQEQEEDKWN